MRMMRKWTTMKLRGNDVILALVLLVFGFMVAFSYQYTKEQSENKRISESLNDDFTYRQQLVEIKQKNKELRNELLSKKTKVHELETNLASQESILSNYVNEKTKLQMLTGGLPITGSGVEVTLRDAEYVPSEENINQYIVHEGHVLKVIHELYAAGAIAIAINGQRIYHDSFISCVGPVISVDGKSYPSPFTISAIGDQDTLYKSLELSQGVVDELVAENITVTLQKKQAIQMNARLTNG